MENTSNKERLVALLFCWFLGIFGAHRFYVGKKGSAWAMLLLSITVVGMVITGVWVLVDLIMIVSGNFKDKNGNVVRKWSI